jgi:phospholipid transport system substrate-binding protein
MHKNMMILILIIFLVLPLTVYAGVPLDTVQTHVNRVLHVLRDPALKGESANEEKTEKLRIISKEMFDFSELSRRTLGRNWKKFNDEQQNEFTSLYRKILEDAYIDKIMDYKDEKVDFHKEKMLTEKKAEVHSNILTETVEIPINYRMLFKGGEWRVYDIVIEGVSLVSNYRSQFKKILTNKPPEKLLETLRKKVKKA